MNVKVPRRILDLDAIDGTELDWRYKGVPARAMGTKLADIGSLGLDVLREEVLFPSALVKLSAIEHNSRWMRRFLEAEGVEICPHGKTTMAPQLFERQFQDGAWGLTAATVGHVRIYRAHGVRRILFANQLVGAPDIEYVLDELERDAAFDFYCLIDSAAGLRRLASAVERRRGCRTIQVLIEVGAPGGRTGVRSLDEGVALALEVKRHSPAIALRGIEAFEGVFGGYDHPQLESVVGRMLDDVVALATRGESEGWFAPGEILLTAGGSAFFDLVARRLRDARLLGRARVILRSGCYLTHDSHHYEVYLERMRERSPDIVALGAGLKAAVEVVAYVQSTPERGLAIAGFGKRDVSYDIALPTPLWCLRPGVHNRPQAINGECRVATLNDQHAYIHASGNPWFQVGDLMGVGISHPCTTFDKWPLLLVVDDDYKVVSAIRTFF